MLPIHQWFASIDLLNAKYFNQTEDESHQNNVWGLYLWGVEGKIPSPNQWNDFKFLQKSMGGKTRKETNYSYYRKLKSIPNNNTLSNRNPLNEIRGTHYRTRKLKSTLIISILAMIKITHSAGRIPQEIKIMWIPWFCICFPFPGVGKAKVRLWKVTHADLYLYPPHIHTPTHTQTYKRIPIYKFPLMTNMQGL